MNLFVYGSLRSKDVLSQVLDEGLASIIIKDAKLKGYQSYWVIGEDYPGIKKEPKEELFGELLEINKNQLSRIDFYEGEGEDYQRRSVEVETADGSIVIADIYYPNLDLQLSREKFSYEQWSQRVEIQSFLKRIKKYMSHYPKKSAIW